MPATGTASEHPQVVTPRRTKQTLTKISRWTLYVSGGLAIALGVGVWPAKITAVSGAHSLTGWLTIVSLWSLAAIAWRSGVSRGSVWFAVGWGIVTALGALAQFQLPAGTWITVLHVVTGVGAVVVGDRLVTRMPYNEVAAQTVRGGVAIKDAAAEFLANKRIAVTGVSRHAGDHGSNLVYRRLRERGYEVFAINPNAVDVEGDRCYASLSSVPGGVDAVVIATRPDRAMATMRECEDLGIRHIWMHRAFGAGSVSEQAAAWGRQRGMRVIDGGCPLMFDPCADGGHKFMRPLLSLTGKVPRHV